MILPDRLQAGLRLVLCGTAAGRVSALRGQYYAGPGNLFWPLLAETGLTPRRLPTQTSHRRRMRPNRPIKRRRPRRRSLKIRKRRQPRVSPANR